MTTHSFSFNSLSSGQLVPILINFLEQSNQPKLAWHVCWLNNEGEQVVGLLPKTAWSAYTPRNDMALKPNTQTFPVPALSTQSPPTQTGARKSIDIEILKVTRQVGFDEINQHSCQTNNGICNNNSPSNINRKNSKINDNKLLGSHLSQSNDATELNRSTEDYSKAFKTVSYNRETYKIDYYYWIEELIQYSNVQNSHKNQLKAGHKVNHKTTNKPKKPTYHSGLMGFIGYDITAKALTPKAEIKIADQPCAFLAHYDIYLKPSGNKGWKLHAEENTPKSALDTVVYYLQSFEDQLPDLLKQSTAAPPMPLKAVWEYQQYAKAFQQTQLHLYHGNSYQINLTQKWLGKLSIPTDHFAANTDISNPKFNSAPRLVDYLPDLHQKTQAPFAGFLGLTEIKASKVPLKSGVGSKFELLSCSPELFVVFDKDHQSKQYISSKPIKGTRPRGTTIEADEQLKTQLANSEKDQAENVMIVDLLRNDLGKYAEVGSVKVPKLFAIDSFSNVHHMVSTITATIKDQHHPLTVLFHSLPAGSITGTPKKRAVEIINELEVAPRGAYCGTMGYMNFEGTGQWNVLIRSLQADALGKVSLWAGGGITVGSKCESEYQECHDKVDNLLHILNPKVEP